MKLLVIRLKILCSMKAFNKIISTEIKFCDQVDDDRERKICLELYEKEFMIS